MKLCSHCNVELTDDNGYRVKSGARVGEFMGYCRVCNRVVKAGQTKIFDALMLEIKAGKPCLDCGRVFPTECMDFDHLRDKKFTIGSNGAGRKWSNVLEEIAKCDLVCANCHRTRTKNRRLCPKTLSNP